MTHRRREALRQRPPADEARRRPQPRASRSLVHVAAGIIARGERVLACQRAADGDHAGRWEFPGGKAESGEDLATALRRELHEELGIEAEIGRRLWRTTHRYAGHTPFTLTFFLVPRYEGSIVNRVFAAVRWVPAGALAALDFLEGDRAFIARLDGGAVRLR